MPDDPNATPVPGTIPGTTSLQDTQSSSAAGQLTPPSAPSGTGIDPSLQGVADMSQQRGALNRPGVPRLVQLIGGLIKPSSMAGPLQRPPSRGDLSLDFIGNFLYSLSQGLSQAGHGPGANLRGFAGAQMAPHNLAIQQFELERQERETASLEESRKAQAAFHTPSVSMLDPDGNPVLIPPSGVGSALAAKYRMAGVTQAADTRAQTAKDIAALKNPLISIDGPMAEALGLPASFAGQKLSASDIHKLVPSLKTVPTGQGVFLVNAANGKVVTRLGEPVAVTTERMRGANRITVEDMRDKSHNFVAAYNAASSAARGVFQARSKGIDSWAKDQAATGYLAFGGIKDPNSQTKFKAEYDRRMNEALQGLADSHNTQLPAVPTGATPSVIPKPQAKGAGPAQSNRQKAMSRLVDADQALKTAAAALQGMKPAQIKQHIDEARSLDASQKQILYGYFGLAQ